MNKSLILKLSLTLGLSVGIISSVILATTRSNSYNEAKADAIYTETNPSNINVTDSSESTIKSYYSSLANLSSSELKGTNLLKNLKTVLINGHKYTSYSNARNWFMITDRDWLQSPLTSSQLNNYQYTSSIITKVWWKRNVWNECTQSCCRK